MATAFLALCATCAVAAPPAGQATDFASRPPEAELIYFVLPDRFADGDPSNDRGGAMGDRTVTGYDPTSPGFYQGGDLAGLTQRLPYIQHLGATAIWVAPVFRNKWVQGRPGHQSAGYHGYWITDFTDVDPHFGTRADFRRFVDAAHARGMKVILDIVINHTADVIKYRECPAGAPCPYRSEAEYPFTRRLGRLGEPINAGFQGDGEAHLTAENFAHLTRPDFAYTPYVPAEEAHVKKPEWLNDPIYYHDRGDFEGSAAADMITHGDFSGLDDVATENPRVVSGFIDIYERWIADFGIDGYRIDTARHVNPGFWQAFIPAILDFAKRHGRPNFHIFGEVYDPDSGVLARHTRVDGFPAVLDFGFQAAAQAVIGGKEGPKRLAHTFLSDPDFSPAHGGAAQLPTFLDNHDMGRFAYLLHKDSPAMGRDELLRRVELGHALLMFSRGAPVIYYGDEQGLEGKGGDQASRQTLFPSRVPSYQAERPLGRAQAGAPGFDEGAPLYRAIAGMAAIRNAHPGLRRGVQEVRVAGDTPGLYVWTRSDPGDGQYVIAINTSLRPQAGDTVVDADRARWTALHGACAPESRAPGSLHVEVPALGWIVCRSGGGA
ncbi:MAG: alpha-amylase [Caulobacteraceae bacterium]|nr:alpha-amylase [Caulobacter sp.]